jgi:hypothetical protein
MANPNRSDKCTKAVQRCASGCAFPGLRSGAEKAQRQIFAGLATMGLSASPITLPFFSLRGGWRGHYDFGLAAASLPAFLHVDMNFLRSLP